MCLIGFAHAINADLPLVLTANRDEFHQRPTLPLAFWPDHPDLLAGRDLQAGGTWFGISRGGRLAAVTNFRDPGANRDNARSRGALVQEFLSGTLSPEAYANSIDGAAYNGFNLLLGAQGELTWFSNRGGQARSLNAGIYGLSNHLLDTPWPKVRRLKQGIAAARSRRFPEVELLSLMQDRTGAADHELPETGVSLEWERLLAPPFIHRPGYGTRSTTVLRVEHGVAHVLELTYDHTGAIASEQRVSLVWDWPSTTAQARYSQADV